VSRNKVALFSLDNLWFIYPVVIHMLYKEVICKPILRQFFSTVFSVQAKV